MSDLNPFGKESTEWQVVTGTWGLVDAEPVSLLPSSIPPLDLKVDDVVMVRTVQGHTQVWVNGTLQYDSDKEGR